MYDNFIVNLYFIDISKTDLMQWIHRFEFLREETDKCIDYLENSGLPLVDFRLYRDVNSSMKTKEVLKLAIARVMRINQALEANYSPEEITDILKKIQVKNFDVNEMDQSTLQKNSNLMLQTVLQKITQLSQENEQLKFIIIKMEKRLERIEENTE